MSGGPKPYGENREPLSPDEMGELVYRLVTNEAMSERIGHRLSATVDELRAEVGRLQNGLHDAEAIGDFAEELRNRLWLKENAEACAKLAAEAVAERDAARAVALADAAKAADTYRDADRGSLSAEAWAGYSVGRYAAAESIRALASKGDGGESGGVTQQGDDTATDKSPGRVLNPTASSSASPPPSEIPASLQRDADLARRIFVDPPLPAAPKKYVCPMKRPGGAPKKCGMCAASGKDAPGECDCCGAALILSSPSPSSDDRV